MLCPKCGAQLSDSAVICRACGAMLPEQPVAPKAPYPPTSQPAEPTASAQPAAPRTCTKCGAPLDDGVRFCTNCGAPAPEPSAPSDTTRSASAGPAQSVPPQQDTANASYTGAAAPFGPGICPRCGSRLAPGARFCTVCGMPAPEAPQGQGDWYAPAPGGGVSSPEIGPKHKPKKLLIGLLCGFAALVVIVAVLAGIFAARQAGEPSTAGGAEVDRLLERYFTYFKADDTDAMLDLFLPEVITYMQDDDTAAGREAALIQLDDWYYDYGKAIDDCYVYDDDSLDASDVREIQRELGVRIDDNVIVACDVTYQNGQDNDFYFEFVQVDAVRGADFIYTDVWYGLYENEMPKEERVRVFADYQVNRELMQLGALGCKFLHCLPATRGEDVTDEVADSAASLCWEQAGNRLTAMRGLLVYFTRCRRVPTELELAAAQEELDTFLDARLGGC